MLSSSCVVTSDVWRQIDGIRVVPGRWRWMSAGRWKGEARRTVTRLKMEADESQVMVVVASSLLQRQSRFLLVGEMLVRPLGLPVWSSCTNCITAPNEWAVGAGVTAPTSSSMYKSTINEWIKSTERSVQFCIVSMGWCGWFCVCYNVNPLFECPLNLYVQHLASLPPLSGLGDSSSGWGGSNLKYEEDEIVETCKKSQ